MYQLHNWVRGLEAWGAEVVSVSPALPAVGEVVFLRHFGATATDAVYVGTPAELLSLWAGPCDCRGMTFFLAGKDAAVAAQAPARGANLVMVELDLLDLYAHVAGVVRRYRDWSLRLLQAARRGRIQEVVDAAAALSGGELFLLNAGYRAVHSGSAWESPSPFARTLREDGLLSPTAAQALLGREWVQGFAPGACAVRDLGEGGWLGLRRVFRDSSVISHMLLFTPEAVDAETLLTLVQETISGIMAQTEGGRYWAGTDFQEMLADLLEGRLTEEAEIQARFSAISRVPQRFCTFLLIEGAEPGRLDRHMVPLLTQLEALFPDSNAAVYHGTVVVLLSRPDRVFQPTPIFDQEQFHLLLTRYDAYAAISNATSRRRRLCSSYLMTRSILQMARDLRASTTERYFFFEDYAEYLMIDLCINSFRELMGHDDIIYLTHPEAVMLYRYDRENHTNLLDVLYYYCLNNCSVSQAARASYMHRNTFSARLVRLQELIKADLASGQIQQRMIFSYKILRYYDRYAKINLAKRLQEPDPSAP